MDEFCPLPGDSLVLGVLNEKGLPFPVLWDVGGSHTPRNIVIWDKLAKQGLKILKTIAEYVFQYHPTCGYKGSNVEFLVLTLYSEDWGELNDYGMGMSGKTSCIGIIPFGSYLAETIINGLARWVNEPHKSSKHPVILMIDGLENLEKMSKDFQRDLRLVLHSGHKKNVYVIGTASKKNFHKVQEWLDGFHSEIYGRDFIDEFDLIEGKNSFIFYAVETEMI
jgi:hypothetical protein